MRILFLIALGVLVFPVSAQSTGHRTASQKQPPVVERSERTRSLNYDFDHDGRLSSAERARSEQLQQATRPEVRETRLTTRAQAPENKLSYLGSATRQQQLRGRIEPSRSRPATRR